MQGLHGYLTDDHNLRHKAHWEAKSDDIVTNTNFKRRFEEIRAAHNQQLGNRRNKLTDLFQAEEAQYKSEYIEKQETPEDIRKRMANRLEELRSARESERKQEVSSKYEKRWRDGADELRNQEGKIAAMHCRLTQENQMWEKEQLEKELQEEQNIYNELWLQDKKRKDNIELERLKNKDELNQKRLTYLNWQRNLKENQKRVLTEREQVEKQMLNEEWDKEKQREQAIKRERDRVLRSRNYTA